MSLFNLLFYTDIKTIEEIDVTKNLNDNPLGPARLHLLDSIYYFTIQYFVTYITIAQSLHILQVVLYWNAFNTYIKNVQPSSSRKDEEDGRQVRRAFFLSFFFIVKAKEEFKKITAVVKTPMRMSSNYYSFVGNLHS